MPLLSFVIPCYRSEKTISRVIDEIIEIVGQRKMYDYEIICVNDGSPDRVYEVLKEIAAANKKVKVIDFSRNMGKHSAVLAGYSKTRGDYVVNLDDDFQSPTYELWKLLDPVENEGYDMSTALYTKKEESLIKRLGSAVNWYVQALLIEQPSGFKMENFYVLKRYVIEEMIKYRNPYPYIPGLILRVTHKIKEVKMQERNRGDGKTSGFTLRKSVSLFLNGFTAFSVKPLRIASMSGFVFSLLGILYGVYNVVNKLINPEILVGYSSIVSILLFSSGMIMMLLGMLGEYIGRIYVCLNNLPQYVIKETINM